jgi:hypothetical protein
MKIIYPNETGIAVLHLTGELPLEEVARKDVPAGVPYLLVEEDAIPADREFRAAWSADFSEPHGVGANYGAGTPWVVVGYLPSGTPIVKNQLTGETKEFTE